MVYFSIFSSTVIRVVFAEDNLSTDVRVKEWFGSTCVHEKQLSWPAAAGGRHVATRQTHPHPVLWCHTGRQQVLNYRRPHAPPPPSKCRLLIGPLGVSRRITQTHVSLKRKYSISISHSLCLCLPLSLPVLLCLSIKPEVPSRILHY